MSLILGQYCPNTEEYLHRLGGAISVLPVSVVQLI